MAERKVYRQDIADMLGISVRSMSRLKLPLREGVDLEGGHARPWWRESVIVEWIPTRPKRGRPAKERPDSTTEGDVSER